MNGLEFRHRGREMVDYLVDYLDNIDARRVTPNIEPGYLKDLIPTYPPDQPEDWDTIMDDVEKKIMIGVSIKHFSDIIQKGIYVLRPKYLYLFIIIGYALATSEVSCLLSGWKFIPIYFG